METSIEKPPEQARPIKFDKLNYAKKLRAAQLTQHQAETIAEGTGDLGDSVVEQIMYAIDQRNFATVQDLELYKTASTGQFSLIHSEFTLVRQEATATKELLITKIDGIEERLTNKFNYLDAKIDGVKQSLDAKIDGVEQRLDAKIDAVEQRLDAKIDGVKQSLEAKIDGVEQRLDVKIDGVKQSLEVKIDGVEHKLLAEMNKHKHDNLKTLIWTNAIVGFATITSLGSFIAYLFKGLPVI